MSLADSAATAAYVRAGHPPVRAIAPLAEGVWRVVDANGRKVVVKHQLFGRLTQGTAYDLLEVERDVLGFLHADGCPVPTVLGIDPDAHCIFLQWVGDRTLDDAIQDGDRAATIQAIRGLCAIERTCAQRADQLEPRIVPSANRAALAAAWDEAGVGRTLASNSYAAASSSPWTLGCSHCSKPCTIGWRRGQLRWAA